MFNCNLIEALLNAVGLGGLISSVARLFGGAASSATVDMIVRGTVNSCGL